jgi:solute carrier family 25 protein 39/40
MVKEKKKIEFNPFKFFESANYILKKEGYKTFYNGLKYSLLQSILNTAISFVSYEKFKEIFSKSFKNQDFAYALASLLSTFLTTTISFPLEYWKTLAYAHEGKC